jgi:hypothetical protein
VRTFVAIELSDITSNRLIAMATNVCGKGSSDRIIEKPNKFKNKNPQKD